MAKKILLIDDDPDIAEVLRTTLSDQGYDVITAENGENLDSLIENKPDLVLLDLKLGPGMSGSEICRKIKAHDVTRGLPVILISADPEVDLVASICGANAAIQKPLDMGNLYNKIKKIMDN